MVTSIIVLDLRAHKHVIDQYTITNIYIPAKNS